MIDNLKDIMTLRDQTEYIRTLEKKLEDISKALVEYRYSQVWYQRIEEILDRD